MKTIYLATDKSCWTERKIREEKLGGTEGYFLRLRDLLFRNNYDVCDPVLNEYLGKTDLVIHSNGFDNSRVGKKHLLFAGSWHASVHEPKVDKVIMVSEYMKQRTGCSRAVVVPPPYEKKIENYGGFAFSKNRLVSTSNPNRWFQNAFGLASILAKKGLSCEWQFAGGNTLYGDGFGECHDFYNRNLGEDVILIYRGILNRHDLLGLLSGAHIWVYPNFRDESETFCAAMIEAAALKIPCVLPRREPFVSVLPEAFFVDSVKEMANKIEEILVNGPDRVSYDVSRYSEDVVNIQLLEIIDEML